MQFLIDENLPFGIVNHLASLNHDVLDIADSKLRGSTINSKKFLKIKLGSV